MELGEVEGFQGTLETHGNWAFRLEPVVVESMPSAMLVGQILLMGIVVGGVFKYGRRIRRVSGRRDS